jgi:hypothetical protein
MVHLRQQDMGSLRRQPPIGTQAMTMDRGMMISDSTEKMNDLVPPRITLKTRWALLGNNISCHVLIEKLRIRERMCFSRRAFVASLICMEADENGQREKSMDWQA